MNPKKKVQNVKRTSIETVFDTLRFCDKPQSSVETMHNTNLSHATLTTYVSHFHISLTRSKLTKIRCNWERKPVCHILGELEDALELRSAPSDDNTNNMVPQENDNKPNKTTSFEDGYEQQE